ncbi:bifunctional diguanylate cyclase/phosphodiesterase [Marinobacterium stanieri]|uniref:EAL domain, c-di-GMP-specific phosphodiesterase class I (Or its enzymatically inactive variant) n=1 Tax=Marinobacterium stanieri TaxID=49186 RepID=A0A1N6SZW3_9GAMM|nr:EAL domain-containing protein [Marinobacterium stanieri]SIQ46639.1 EAL domain, c-di-GMP-specific phosphodiesterase class I (or its enzymatically inactive variant) [Marinobacterium stanieri]
MSAQEPFVFQPEQAPAAAAKPWKVLSVEDDAGYQASLVHALSLIQVDGRSLQVLKARSALEAARLLPEYPDISIVLLDVVMEQDDAGLRLVNTIRNVIRNSQVRIVLLTGQPGMAPRPDVLKHYDIDDYWCKSDLTHEHLTSVITGNLRTWERTSQLENARRGLQQIVTASQALSQLRSLKPYLSALLDQLELLLPSLDGGLICHSLSGTRLPEDMEILASKGNYSAQGPVSLQPYLQSEPMLADLIRQACLQGRHQQQGALSVLLFSKADTPPGCYLAVLKTQQPLSAAEQNLLDVFCENIGTGLTNLSLYDQLSHLAYQDPQLGMANRNALKQTLRELPAQARSEHTLIVIKLNELNEATLNFGELFSDSVLRSMADRLATELKALQLLARIDRNSFALLLPSQSAPSTEALNQLLDAPVLIDDSEHLIPARALQLPLSVCDAHTPEQILRLAELSLDTRRHARESLLMYDGVQEQQMRERYQLLLNLRRALKYDQLSIALQPKIALATGHLAGFEALVRWQQADGSYIPPDQFIPVAESAGLISELDLSVLAKTLDASRQLRQQGIDLPIAFNTCSIDLLRPGYFDEMLTLIRTSGVPFNRLELEVTETQAMAEYEVISKQMRQLLDAGMGVSIDDFGTGYSSLAHITDLAASVLKIDRTFIARMETSPKAQHLVDMILRMSAFFGFQVVAEGIETESQRQYLASRGCQLGQGYLFARPMPPEKALAWALGHPRAPD